MLKVCAEAGCPVLTRTTRCVDHTRERDRARGSSTARGYGSKHQAIRRDLQLRMEAGETFTCWRCGSTIDPDAWDLGHRDDREGYAGPECVPCNRAVSGR